MVMLLDALKHKSLKCPLPQATKSKKPLQKEPEVKAKDDVLWTRLASQYSPLQNRKSQHHVQAVLKGLQHRKGTKTHHIPKLQAILQHGRNKVLVKKSHSTSTDGMRQHLAKNHLDDWIPACDALGVAITADCAQPYVESYCNAHPESAEASPFVRTDPEDVPSSFGVYSHEGLANYCMLWIVADDQIFKSIYTIENRHFRNIILYLRCDLKDSDIPHADHLCAKILLALDDFFEKTYKELKSVWVFFIRCFPHTVNLAYKAVIEALESMADQLISRLRQLIRAIRGSSLHRENFLTTVKTCIKKELEAISRFLSMDDFQDLLRYSLLPDEWTLLELMNEVLEIPHAFQQQLSAEKRPTLCDAIPSFAAMTSLWEEMKVRHPVLVPAIKAGLEKLSDYYHLFRPAEYVAAQNTFVDAVGKYCNSQIHSNIAQNAQPFQSTQRIDTDPAAWANHLLQWGRATSWPSPAEHTVEQEVDMYLLDTTTATSSLMFWQIGYQENRLCYPTIYQLVLDILPIQGFKETITTCQSRLSPEMMEALQILKFSIKADGGLDFTAGLSSADELQQLEAVLEDKFMPVACRLGANWRWLPAKLM
ncbi:ribonuclease H-like domain-containing protein [Armillaria nabsnona]|nr:ribonuclease H-like domain-containing protein [Armillaria nabsnona]